MLHYKGLVIARNSDAYKIWEQKDFKKLDQHLKTLDQKQQDEIERYKQKETTNERFKF